MLCHLPVWQHFGENICGYFIGGTVHKRHFLVLDHITNEVVANVYVFHAGMVVISLGKPDRGLIVTKQSGRSERWMR